MNPQRYTGIITKRSQLTKTVFHFYIQNENPKELLFLPGQYATFIIDPQIRRQYSFCSPPDPTLFELIVDVSPMGPGSKYFLEKREGDKVEYLAPFGNFTLSQNPLKKIFIATGTGIAPFRSMLLNGTSNTKCQMSNQFQNPNNQTTNYELRTTNVSLYWGLRFEDDVYWDNELKSLVGQYSGFQYFLSLSKPGANWAGLKGHITEHVLQKEKNLRNCEFYLCGNSAMITEMKNRLSDNNIKKEQIKIDLFY